MAYPNITPLLTSIKPAGIKKVYIRNGAELWQTLGNIRKGELKFSPVQTNNTLGQNLSTAEMLVEAKFELLQTAVLELENLDDILLGVSGVANDFMFQLVDAAAPPATAEAVTYGWVQLLGTQVGVKAKYVASGNPSEYQFIEVMISGVIPSSAYDAAIKASTALDNFHIVGTGDTTFAKSGTLWGTYSATALVDYGILANQHSAGIRTVAIDNPLSSGAETLLTVKNGIVEFDFVSEMDSLNRHRPYAIDINIEYDAMITDDATLLLLSTMNSTNTNVVITLVDGKTLTLSSQLGVGIYFENIGDFDQIRKLRFSHKGRVAITDTIISAIVGP